MKKILIALVLFSVSYGTYAQTCEEREKELLTALGGVSASFLYNTYLGMGGIADNYAAKSKSYDAAFCKNLLNEQKAILETVEKLMKDLQDNKSLKSADDHDFVGILREAMVSLNKQCQFLIDYINSGKTEDLTIYDNQRQISWKKLADLLGIDD